MHTQALSDQLLPTADACLQATFSCVFQSISRLFPPYEQHIFVHDKISLCFLSLTDLRIQKQRKTQASWVSATDSYGEKSLPALQLHFAPQRWRHVQTTNRRVVSASDVTPTDRWLNVWCAGTLFWKNFRSVEVFIGLVELYRISGRRVCRVLLRSAWKQRCSDAKPPHERRKPSCLQMWRRALIRIN